MNGNAIRSLIAQVCGGLTWILDFTGHLPQASIIADPHTTEIIWAFIAASFNAWGLIEHLLLSLKHSNAVSSLQTIAVNSNTAAGSLASATLTPDKKDVAL